MITGESVYKINECISELRNTKSNLYEVINDDKNYCKYVIENIIDGIDKKIEILKEYNSCRSIENILINKEQN